MNSHDFNIQKFNYIIWQTEKHLAYSAKHLAAENERGIHDYRKPLIMIVGNTSHNNYIRGWIKTIYETQKKYSVKKHDRFSGGPYLLDDKIWYCWNHDDSNDKEKLKNTLMEIKELTQSDKEYNFKKWWANSYTSYPAGSSAVSIKNSIVFWNLFITVLDDEIFNEKMQDTIELAHFFEFTEDMIHDWCSVIQYILSGNLLNKFDNLRFYSEEATKFFVLDEESMKLDLRQMFYDF